MSSRPVEASRLKSAETATAVTNKPLVGQLVVIDASVLLAIPLPDPQANKDYAMALLFAVDKGDVTPILTQLCCHEVAAKLVRKVRGQTISAATARSFFDLLEDVNFQHVVDIRSASLLFDDAWNMGCGSYDAAYIRAAVDNDAALATLDRKLLPHLPGQGVAHWQA